MLIFAHRDTPLQLCWVKERENQQPQSSGTQSRRSLIVEGLSDGERRVTYQLEYEQEQAGDVAVHCLWAARHKGRAITKVPIH